MRKAAYVAIVLVALASLSSATAQSPSEIDQLLRTAVEQKRVPMAVAMVADARSVIYEHAAGASKDTIFRIASMTKPITSVAVMQLVQNGKVKLDEPALTYLPELASVRVLDG